MAFDKHTAKLAKYYRSVGQSPAGARRLAKEMSASYISPQRKNWDRLTSAAANITKFRAKEVTVAAHFRGRADHVPGYGIQDPKGVRRSLARDLRMARRNRNALPSGSIGAQKFGNPAAFLAGHREGLAFVRHAMENRGKNSGSFKTKKGTYKKGAGGRFVGSGG
jgi:hypothetical protein